MKSVRTRKTARKSFDVAGWMAGDDSLDIISGFARRCYTFSRLELEDTISEIAVALLERQHEAPATEEEFLTWAAEVVAPEVVRRLDNKNRIVRGNEVHVVNDKGENAVNDAPELTDDEQPDFEFCHQLVVHERRLADRVRYALAKLSEKQRQVIRDKFFRGRHLSAAAAESEMCDSSHRMRLLRAKKKLAAMIDREGYALAA